MKRVIFALLFGLAAVALAHMHGSAQRYRPMVEVSAPAGITFIAVQDATAERQACGDANDRFLEPVKAGCTECKVIAARCERVLDEEGERARREGEAMPGYVVVAPGLRLGIAGPQASAKANCEYIAADMAKRGMRSAACVRSKAASAS